MNDEDVHSQLYPFGILTEVARDEGCFAHVPTLPGLCFRADDPEEAKRIAVEQIVNYSKWLVVEDLVDLNMETEALIRCARIGNFTGVRVVEKERREGSPIWISGNPAVLFDHDRIPLDNQTVSAHFRFARQVVNRMRLQISVLSPAQLAYQPAAKVRSVDETLTHIGNCVWWYCARIDDELPEPDERANETPIDRIERLFEAADEYLPAVPLQERTTVHIPTRFLTKDAQEAWTHTKVCRRQAEHLWEHFQTLKQEVSIAEEADGVTST
jgi:predicted RNase H-like HicB family nuclease